MHIREMKKHDIDRVRSIAHATWRDTYSQFIPIYIQDKVLKDAYSDEEMERRFNHSFNLVAELDNKIVGYAFFSGDLTGTDVYLESIYIHPDHQREGIGRRLIEFGLTKYAHPNNLTLTVYRHNSSITFYEKEGFEMIKETEGDFYGHSVGFIQMRKLL